MYLKIKQKHNTYFFQILTSEQNTWDNLFIYLNKMFF